MQRQHSTKKQPISAATGAKLSIQNYQNGIYNGYTVKSACQGKGVYWWDSGELYFGDWDEGQIHGEGIMFFPYGGYLKGNFFKNKINGAAFLKFPNGDYYQGFWRHGKLDGKCLKYFAEVNNWALCTYSKGQFQNCLNKGRGQPNITFEEKLNLHIDSDAPNQEEGGRVGVLSYDDGGKYYGVIQGEIPHGIGIMHYQDGKFDVGLYQRGLLQGMGRLHMQNGDICEGHIKDGRIFGKGFFYKKEADLWVFGVFKDDDDNMEILDRGKGFPLEEIIEWKKKKHSADSLRMPQSIPNDLFSIPVLGTAPDTIKQNSKSPCRNASRMSRQCPAKMRLSSCGDSAQDYHKLLYFESSPTLSSKSKKRDASPHSYDKKCSSTLSSKNLRAQIDKRFQNEADFLENYADQKENIQPLTQNETIVFRDSHVSPSKKQRSALRQLADITGSNSDHENSIGKRRSVRLFQADPKELIDENPKDLFGFQEEVELLQPNQNWLQEQATGVSNYGSNQAAQVSVMAGQTEKNMLELEDSGFEKVSNGQVVSRNSIRSVGAVSQEKTIDANDVSCPKGDSQFRKRPASSLSLKKEGFPENALDQKNNLNGHVLSNSHSQSGLILEKENKAEEIRNNQTESDRNLKKFQRLDLTGITSQTSATNRNYSDEQLRTSHSRQDNRENSCQTEGINQDSITEMSDKRNAEEPSLSKVQKQEESSNFIKVRLRSQSMQSQALVGRSASPETVSNSEIIEINQSMATKELTVAEGKHRSQKIFVNLSVDETNNTKNDLSLDMQNKLSEHKHQRCDSNAFSFRKETPSKVKVELASKEVMTESMCLEGLKISQDKFVEDKGIQTDFVEIPISNKPETVTIATQLTISNSSFAEEEDNQQCKADSQLQSEALKSETLLNYIAEKGKPPRAPMKKKNHNVIDKSETAPLNSTAQIEDMTRKQEFEKVAEDNELQNTLEISQDVQTQEEERIVEYNEPLEFVFKSLPVQSTKSPYNKYSNEHKSMTMPLSHYPNVQFNSKLPNNTIETIKSGGTNDDVTSVSIRVYTPKRTKENSPASFDQKREEAKGSQFIYNPLTIEIPSSLVSDPSAGQPEISSIEFNYSNPHSTTMASPLNIFQDRKRPPYPSQDSTPLGIQGELPQRADQMKIMGGLKEDLIANEQAHQTHYFLSRRAQSVNKEGNIELDQHLSRKGFQEEPHTEPIEAIQQQVEVNELPLSNSQTLQADVRSSNAFLAQESNSHLDFCSPQFFQESDKKISELLPSEFNLQAAHQALDMILNRSRRTLNQYSIQGTRHSNLSEQAESIVQSLNQSRFLTLDPSNRNSMVESDKPFETRHEPKIRSDELPLYSSTSLKALPPSHLRSDSPRDNSPCNSVSNISPSKQPQHHRSSNYRIEPNLDLSTNNEVRNHEASLLPNSLSPVKRIDPSLDWNTDRLGFSALNLLQNRPQDSPSRGSPRTERDNPAPYQETQKNLQPNKKDLITPIPKEKMFIKNFALSQSAQNLEFGTRILTEEALSSRRELKQFGNDSGNNSFFDKGPNQKSFSDKSAVRFTKEQLLAAIPCSSINGDQSSRYDKSDASYFQVDRRGWAGKINEESAFTDSRIDSINRFGEESLNKFSPRNNSPIREIKFAHVYEDIPKQALQSGGGFTSNPHSHRDGNFVDDSSVIRFDPNSSGKLATLQDDDELRRYGSYNSRHKNENSEPEDITGDQILDVDKFRKYFQKGLSKIEENVDEGTIGRSIETLHFIERAGSPSRETSEEGESHLSVRVGAAFSMTRTMKDLNRGQRERVNSMNLDDSGESKWSKSLPKRARQYSDLNLPSYNVTQNSFSRQNTTRPVSDERNNSKFFQQKREQSMIKDQNVQKQESCNIF